jgi:hypothetical protein
MGETDPGSCSMSGFGMGVVEHSCSDTFSQSIFLKFVIYDIRKCKFVCSLPLLSV